MQGTLSASSHLTSSHAHSSMGSFISPTHHYRNKKNIKKNNNNNKGNNDMVEGGEYEVMDHRGCAGNGPSFHCTHSPPPVSAVPHSPVVPT